MLPCKKFSSLIHKISHFTFHYKIKKLFEILNVNNKSMGESGSCHNSLQIHAERCQWGPWNMHLHLKKDAGKRTECFVPRKHLVNW